MVLMGLTAPVLAPATRALASSDGAQDTGVVDMSNTPDMSEGEVPLAVDPLNPRHLASISNTYQAALPDPLTGLPVGNGLMSVGLYTSHDGGRTWKTNRIQQGGAGRTANPAAPVAGGSPEFSDPANLVTTDADVIWDRHGNLYVETGCLHTIYANGDEAAHIWHSTDGGDTFDGPYTAISVNHEEHEELDRPWMAVDNTGGARDGSLYIAFETGPFTDDPPKVFVKRSTDGAKTWSPTVRVDDGTYETQFNPRNRPIVDASGALYIAYDRSPVSNTPFNAQQAPIQLVVAKSTDGANTFRRTVIDDNISRVTSPDEALGSSYSEMISAIAADPTAPGRVAVAWPELIDTNNSRIVLRYTSDGGAHWSPRVDVADDPAGTANQHDHVATRWMPDGRLAVGWRDRRGSGGAWTANFREWIRLFTLDGSGLKPSGGAVELTNKPQLPEVNYKSSTMPDEFQGLTATSNAVMMTWAQPVGKFTDVVFRSVPLSTFSAQVSAVASGGSGGLPGSSTSPGVTRVLARMALLALVLALGASLPGTVRSTLPKMLNRKEKS